MQSPKLARAIYYTCEIGDEILSKLYNAVAIALAYIYKLDKGEKIDKPEIEVPDDLILTNLEIKMFNRNISKLMLPLLFLQCSNLSFKSCRIL